MIFVCGSTGGGYLPAGGTTGQRFIVKRIANKGFVTFLSLLVPQIVLPVVANEEMKGHALDDIADWNRNSTPD